MPGLVDYAHSLLLESLVLLVKSFNFIGDGTAILDPSLQSLYITLEPFYFLEHLGVGAGYGLGLVTMAGSLL